MKKDNKKILERLLNERKLTRRKIEIETNSFVKTITSWEVTIFMLTKLTPNGLFAIFYGKDGIGRNPDETKPFYVFENQLNIDQTKELKNEISKYHYDNYFEIAQHLTPENDDHLEIWFPTLNEAIQFAEKRYNQLLLPLL